MEPYPLHGKHRVPTTGPPGKSPDISFISCPSWAFLDIQDLIRSDFTQFKKKKKDFARSPGGGAVLKRVRSIQRISTLITLGSDLHMAK